jgi:hypothetical protein
MWIFSCWDSHCKTKQEWTIKGFCWVVPLLKTFRNNPAQFNKGLKMKNIIAILFVLLLTSCAFVSEDHRRIWGYGKIEFYPDGTCKTLESKFPLELDDINWNKNYEDNDSDSWW